MSELSAVGKIKRALKLAKLAEVGMTLSYFDVIELLGEIEWLEEANRKLFEMHDGAIISELRRGLELQYADNAELQRKLAMADHDNSTLADESIAYKERATVAEAELSDMEVRDRIRYNEVMSRALKAERMVERFIEAGERLSIHSRMVDDIDVLNALVAEWQARNG